MSEEATSLSLKDELVKSKGEFDTAILCMYQALKAFNERMERIEKWILESQKK